MQCNEFEERINDLKRHAHGRWTDILRALHVDDQILNKRNQPCPLCGGTDRFQYTDKYGEGNYFCRGCGPGGGIKLLQAYHGWDFGTTLKHIEECIGTVAAQRRSTPPDISPEKVRALARRLWDEAVPVVHGDDVDRYLGGRGVRLSAYPKTLRFHPSLGYFEKDASGRSRKVRDCPAMLAPIQGRDGALVALHRTYLLNGRKAAGAASKKVLGAGFSGAAVRLYDATDELAVAEGIETALAVHCATGKPVWAALSAGNMEKLWIPESVRHLCIYADNDANAEFDGQACAFILARRLKKTERNAGSRHVEVFVPKLSGNDWADVWLSRLENATRAA